MSEPVRDCIGNEVTPGCTVVYPVRRGYTVTLKRMAVTAVCRDRLSGHNATGRPVHVRNLATVVVVVPPEKRNADV